MNTQEIFDTVANHLLTQNARAMRDNVGGCAYRGKDGLTCAVGCLIADEFYDPALEGEGVSADEVVQALNESLGMPIGDREQDLLGHLQRIHDNEQVENWPKELKYIAQRFDLKYHGDQYGQQPVSA